MFIDNLTPVNIISGAYQGRFGVVQKIRIYTETAQPYAVAFCDLFTPHNGGFERVAILPHELEPRKLTPQQTETLVLDVLGAEMERAA